EVLLVLNHPPPGEDLRDPERTVIAPMEPKAGQVRWPDSTRRAVLQVRDHERYGNPWEWHLGRSYTQLRHDAIDKARDLSVVVSGRRDTVAHRQRLDLVHPLP